jgi:hypothetical protein
MNKNLCCICRKNPVSDAGYQPRCEAAACKAIHHLCFSGVADGLTSAKNASRQELEFAFDYLIKNTSQKTLRVGIAREITKRIKLEIANRKS